MVALYSSVNYKEICSHFNSFIISQNYFEMHFLKQFCCCWFKVLIILCNNSPLSPELDILSRSRKAVPMTLFCILSLSLSWIRILLHNGGNNSVKITCSFQVGSYECLRTDVRPCQL